MFGLSFGELIVLIIVAIVVIGPKDLPKVLRKLGRWAGQLRRMASDLRSQSGIDDVLRQEGLADDIAEIRRLARGDLDVRGMIATDPPAPPPDLPEPDPVREYPRECVDSYGALPESALLYTETLASSALAKDPLYRLGDADAVLPEAEASVAPAADEPTTSPADMPIDHAPPGTSS